MISIATPTYSNLLSNGDHLIANHRLLRVKLAPFRHERAEGKLPATLTDLVPHFLEAVPADPFDGSPIRYIAVRGLV